MQVPLFPLQQASPKLMQHLCLHSSMDYSHTQRNKGRMTVSDSARDSNAHHLAAVEQADSLQLTMLTRQSILG